MRPVAAIDCGTNSTRLLVASPDGKAVERVNRITRLGEGVDRTGRLGREGIARTISVLEDYRRVFESYRTSAIRITATSAARDASNRDEFFDAAEAAVGVRPELLGGAEEGRLSFRGAVSSLGDLDGLCLVVDIGGGSTELIVGSDPHQGPTGVYSMDVGCVRLTERFLASDPPSDAQLASARRFVGYEIAKALDEVPQLAEATAMVGLAGTVACLAALDQCVDGSERHLLHHHRLTRLHVEEMYARLAALPAARRYMLPGVEEGRGDVIVGGAIVLSEVMARFGFEECLTSEADILDGLAASMLPGGFPGSFPGG
jgi:exopolyphosphatase/guanosine-5'-triphosphate,3'-diphosphate pyrophosphatase